MPPSIAPRAAVERLQLAGFLYRNGGTTPTHRFEEYERQQNGFLQRLVVYASLAPDATPALGHAVLRTKCAPKPKMVTVYDVEHLLCRGPNCVDVLVEAADTHWQQFATSGGASFFARPGDAAPFHDVKRPLEVFAA